MTFSTNFEKPRSFEQAHTLAAILKSMCAPSKSRDILKTSTKSSPSAGLRNHSPLLTLVQVNKIMQKLRKRKVRKHLRAVLCKNQTKWEMKKFEHPT